MNCDDYIAFKQFRKADQIQRALVALGKKCRALRVEANTLKQSKDNPILTAAYPHALDLVTRELKCAQCECDVCTCTEATKSPLLESQLAEARLYIDEAFGGQFPALVFSSTTFQYRSGNSPAAINNKVRSNANRLQSMCFSENDSASQEVDEEKAALLAKLKLKHELQHYIRDAWRLCKTREGQQCPCPQKPLGEFMHTEQQSSCNCSHQQHAFKMPGESMSGTDSSSNIKRGVQINQQSVKPEKRNITEIDNASSATSIDSETSDDSSASSSSSSLDTGQSAHTNENSDRSSSDEQPSWTSEMSELSNQSQSGSIRGGGLQRNNNGLYKNRSSRRSSSEQVSPSQSSSNSTSHDDSSFSFTYESGYPTPNSSITSVTSLEHSCDDDDDVTASINHTLGKHRTTEMIDSGTIRSNAKCIPTICILQDVTESSTNAEHSTTSTPTERNSPTYRGNAIIDSSLPGTISSTVAQTSSRSSTIHGVTESTTQHTSTESSARSVAFGSSTCQASIDASMPKQSSQYTSITGSRSCLKNSSNPSTTTTGSRMYSTTCSPSQDATESSMSRQVAFGSPPVQTSIDASMPHHSSQYTSITGGDSCLRNSSRSSITTSGSRMDSATNLPTEGAKQASMIQTADDDDDDAAVSRNTRSNSSNDSQTVKIVSQASSFDDGKSDPRIMSPGATISDSTNIQSLSSYEHTHKNTEMSSMPKTNSSDALPTIDATSSSETASTNVPSIRVESPEAFSTDDSLGMKGGSTVSSILPESAGDQLDATSDTLDMGKDDGNYYDNILMSRLLNVLSMPSVAGSKAQSELTDSHQSTHEATESKETAPLGSPSLSDHTLLTTEHLPTKNVRLTHHSEPTLPKVEPKMPKHRRSKGPFGSVTTPSHFVEIPAITKELLFPEDIVMDSRPVNMFKSKPNDRMAQRKTNPQNAAAPPSFEYFDAGLDGFCLLPPKRPPYSAHYPGYEQKLRNYELSMKWLPFDIFSLQKNRTPAQDEAKQTYRRAYSSSKNNIATPYGKITNSAGS